MSDPGTYSLRDSKRGEKDLYDCFVQLHADGSVVLVVDGEQLFRFDSLDALLAQYELVRGERQSDSPPPDSAAYAAWRELAAAELAVNVAVSAMHSRPRAEKTLLDPRVARAIDRVRLARDRLADTPT